MPPQPKIWPHLLLAAVLSAAARTASADPNVQFQRMIDTNAPFPGETGNFKMFSNPSCSGSNVAFSGEGPSSVSQQGQFAIIDGVFTVIADINTPVPEGNGNFDDFATATPPSLSGRMVSFLGISVSESGANVSGIYSSFDETLIKVADTNTPIPHGAGNFTSFSRPLSDRGGAVFRGSGLGQGGIYAWIEGAVVVVADRNTPLPNSSAMLLSFGEPSYDSGRVAFRATNTLDFTDSVLTNASGALQTVVDENTPIPGTSGNFSGFASVTISNGFVAFGGEGSGQDGIYSNFIDPLTIVADQGTGVPNSPGNFRTLMTASSSNGAVAFFAQGDFLADDGIYIYRGGEIFSVIKRNQVVDGQPVTGAGLHEEGLDGHQLALQLGFANGVEALYMATVSVDCLPGDTDDDEQITAGDKEPFVATLLNQVPATFDAMCRADANEDGLVDGRDIQVLLNLMVQE